MEYKHKYLRRAAFAVGFVLASWYLVPVGGVIAIGFATKALWDEAARRLDEKKFIG